MISKVIADFRTAAAAVGSAGSAVQVAANGADGVLAVILGLFGEVPHSPMMAAQPMDGVFSERRRQHMIERVKIATQSELRAHGIGSVASKLGITSFANLPSFSIADVWPSAMAAGAEELILEKLHGIEGFTALMAEGMEASAEVGAIGDGKIAVWIKNAIQWVVDHKDQIFAIVQDVIMFLVSIGLI